MNLEVRHLKLIVAVAEEGGVTKAGNRLHLTQSALSHQLRDVEDRLGAALFQRVNKRMILTSAGERLLKSARTVLCELERTEEDLRQIALNREGILRISTECYTFYHWLPAMLKSFNKKFPRVEVQIVVEATNDPLQSLLDGKLDLALFYSNVRDRRFLVKPLFQDELVVIMNPHHSLALHAYVKAEDFADQHMIMYADPIEESLLFQKILFPASIMPAKISRVQLTEAIVEMVKSGLGISVMAKWAVAPQIRSGALRALPLTKRGFRRQWSAVMLKNNSLPPYLLEFAKLLADDCISKFH